jgi:hypothetical protein
MKMSEEEITSSIIQFLRSIGLPVYFANIDADTFLPGILINKGAIIIDKHKLKYPGDILHEAGHLAVVLPEERNQLAGNAAENRSQHEAEEMMSIAWSYAACIHLGIDAHIVFHEHGYKGGGSTLVENFSQGRYVGVPMLQWLGMTLENKKAVEKGTLPYPHMLKWLREEPAN